MFTEESAHPPLQRVACRLTPKLHGVQGVPSSNLGAPTGISERVKKLRWSDEWSHFRGATSRTPRARQDKRTTSIVYAHMARFDDPQPTAQRLPLKQPDGVYQCSSDGPVSLRTEPEHPDPGVAT